MTYDIILFDLDDTLFDFTKAEQHALSEVFRAYRLDDDLQTYKTHYEQISSVLWQALEQGDITLTELGSERFRRLFAQHNLDLDAVAFNKAYLTYLGKQTELVEGAERVIHALAHKRLAIITNGYTDVQTARIANSPFSDAFEQLIISEAIGFQKPHAGIFDVAFTQLHITEKANVLLVGDSLTSDIRGGHNYGIATCWFNPHNKENHTSFIPTYEVRKLEDLFEIVK